MEIKIFIAILTLGMAFVIISLLNTAKEFKTEKQSGIKTTATIIGYETSKNNDGKNTYFPFVQYKTLTGQNIESYQTNGFSRRKFKENSTISILYQEKDPESFIVDGENTVSSFAIWGISCALIMYFFLLYVIDTQFSDGSMTNALKTAFNF
jgi:Protein of unknown function (DUF3592)